MKLVNKRTVFLSSADRASGDLGQFNVPMPLDFTFDPQSVFKLYLSQINMRNTFFAIRPDNCQYFINVAALNSPAPAPPPTNPPYGVWIPAKIPNGAPVASEIAAGINQTLQTMEASVYCALRYGRLYFVHNTNGLNQFQVNLYFGYTGTGPNWTTGPANEPCGFPEENKVYVVIPDANKLPSGTTLRYSFDSFSNLPKEPAMSPVLMNTNDMTDVLVTTNMPHENYALDGTGIAVTGVTVDIPVLVPAGGTICYTDNTGINAIYERGRTTVNTLSVLVTDKFLKKIVPNNDWSFVLTIEQLEDSPAMQLNELKKLASSDEEVIQLLKMLLLQGEMD